MITCGTQVVSGSSGGAASPTTTRGDLIRRGASADERLAVGASGSVLQSDGTDPGYVALASLGLVAGDVSGVVATTLTYAGLDLSANRSAADVRAALGPAVSSSLASASGWTTDAQAGASSTVNTGTARAVQSIPSGVVASRYALVYRSFAESGSGLSSALVDARARVASITGRVAGSVDDVAELLLLRSATYVGVRVRDDGTLLARSDIGDGTASGVVAGYDGGNLWLRLVVVGGAVVALYAVAATPVDADWVTLHAWSRTSGLPYNVLRLGSERASDHATTFAVEWAAVTQRRPVLV